MRATILHIDDEPLGRGVAHALRGRGCRVVENSEPSDVLRLVEDGAVDLVVAELRLERCDGIELLQQIRGCDAKLPILVVTVCDRTPELYSETLDLGVTDFLTKPVLESELRSTILELIGDLSEDADESWGDRTQVFVAPVSGDLAELPIAELFRRCFFEGTTGVCVVSNRRKRMGVQLRNGSVVAIGASGWQESSLDFLVRSERITPLQKGKVLQRVTPGARDTMALVLELGFVEEFAFVQAMRQRVQEQLNEVLAWDRGSYRLLPGKELKAGSNVEFDHPMALLLLRCSLHNPDAGHAGEALAKRGPLYVSRGEAIDDSLSAELAARDREFLEKLNGDRTVAELLATDDVAAGTLHGMWLAGMVQFHSDPVLVLEELVVVDSTSEIERDVAELPQDLDPAASEPLHDRLTELHARILSQNDLAVLGVNESSGDEEVRQAYEELFASLPNAEEVAPFPALVSLLEKIRARIERAHDNLIDADSRRAYVALCREEEREREAKAASERALRAEEWFRKGERALDQGDFDHAVEAFGMANHNQPEEGDYLGHLGYAMYLANPDIEVVMREAMEHIAKGIKLSPQRIRPYLYLARIFKLSGDLPSAKKVYAQCLRLDSDCHEAGRELRLIAQRAKQPIQKKGLLDRLRQG